MTTHTTTTALPRRDFLKGILATGALSIITSKSLLAAAKSAAAAAAKPGDKINLAAIGAGGRAASLLKSLHETGLVNVVAICDVDATVFRSKTNTELFPKAARFQDFRQMFDKMAGQIDAVSVGTPDHSHFPAVILAMSLGKHVYVEKPMAHTFRQIELLMAAEKKYNVVTQMGNQGHSGPNFFQFKAWSEAGIIKNVTRITAFMNNDRRWHDANSLKRHGIAFSKLTDFLPAQPVPATLDWNVWIAVSRDLKFNAGYTKGEWRSWYELGNGALGDWGAHIFDTAHRFLDLGLPYEVDPVKIVAHNPFVFPQASTLAFRFPKRGDKPPCELTWYEGVNNLPPLPDNMGKPVVDADDVPAPTAGTLDFEKVPPGKIIYGENLTFKGGAHGSALQIIPESKARDMASRLPVVPKSPSNHYKNFILACMGKEEVRSPFSISGPLCQTMSLGVISQRLATKLAFDRSTKQFTNNKIANELLLGPPPRKEWEQFYKL